MIDRTGVSRRTFVRDDGAGSSELVAYAPDWHLSGSSAFESLLVEPLAPSARVTLREWDGDELPEPLPPGARAAFCMFPPSAAAMKDPDARLVWIPMWDHARIYDQAWWNRLPRSLRVVALSDPVRKRAEAAGLATLSLRFFPDPDEMPPAEWAGDRVAVYWNRTGMIGAPGLERLCRALSVSKLIFRRQLDPRIPREMDWAPPPRLGATEVVTIEPRGRAEYLEQTASANIFVAPRTSEGVGVTVLEGMGRGCCVLAYDAPAMNEYIRDGENGILFRRRESRLRSAALKRLLRRPPYVIDVDQPWRRFSRRDPASLGKQARVDHIEGRRAWVDSLPRYRAFVVDW